MNWTTVNIQAISGGTGKNHENIPSRYFVWEFILWPLNIKPSPATFGYNNKYKDIMTVVKVKDVLITNLHSTSPYAT